METIPSKPKRKNSKAKGSNFERVVAKALSEWWGEPFRRTPASGGLHWQKDNRVSGDIVPPPDSNFPFSTECKKHEGWNFEQIIKGTGDVTKWWEQCINDSKENVKLPLLVFSKNRSPIYYMMNVDTWKKMPELQEKMNWFVTEFYLEEELQSVAIGFFDHLLELPKDWVVHKITFQD